MAERSWRGFAAQREKYHRARSSQDFRKKQGILERMRAFLGKLFGA